ncbi:hypothetical protein AB7Z57_18775 [Providencia alcalifaciens]
MDKSRQQFEYWYFNNHSHEQKYPLHKVEGGKYFYDGTRKAWIAWQASRDSLEIELPDASDSDSGCPNYHDGYNTAMGRTYDELISNGVKIKNG